MTLPTLLQLAKQGDSTAIAVLMSAALRTDKTRVECLIEGDCLVVTLRSLRPLNQHAAIAFIRRGLLKLQPLGLRSVRAYAWLMAREFPIWVIEFPIAAPGQLPLSTPQQTPPFKPEASEHPSAVETEPLQEWVRLSGVDYRDAELPIAVRESGQTAKAGPTLQKSASRQAASPLLQSTEPSANLQIVPTSPQPPARVSSPSQATPRQAQTSGQELFKVGFVVVVAVMVYFVVTGV